MQGLKASSSCGRSFSTPFIPKLSSRTSGRMIFRFPAHLEMMPLGLSFGHHFALHTLAKTPQVPPPPLTKPTQVPSESALNTSGGDFCRVSKHLPIVVALFHPFTLQIELPYKLEPHFHASSAPRNDAFGTVPLTLYCSEHPAKDSSSAFLLHSTVFLYSTVSLY